MAAEEYEDDYRSELEDETLAEEVAAPAAQPYVIEPELQQPTPRSVKVRGGTRFGRWFLIALTLGVPSLLAYFGNESQNKWELLRDHGVDGIATLASTEPRKTGKNSHPPRGTYRYVIGRESHTITDELTDDEYRRARIGVDQLKIVYLPERPSVSRTRENLAGGGTYAREAIILWVVAGVLGLVFLVIWLFAERNRSRRIRLAEEGIAVPTTSLDLVKASAKKSDQTYNAIYSFQHDGATIEGKASFVLKIAQELMVTGAATVLVDPGNPKCFELYRSVSQTVIVEPAGGMSGFAGG